ncbi:MAG: Mrp/NBP35 family ATP-binding protein [Candidatus Bathyarchaeota archaeon]|nr:Mrp/NBP35 family ATP-binding protein [Candidatus Bathyarchaeota archaeon]
MSDPRTVIIDERLRKVGRIVAVSSGKGGVGKSMVATTLALTLAKEGCKVGLFDLDFTSPSTHIILGVKDEVWPEEEKGLVPPVVEGLEYMSLIYYSGNQAAPLRGADTSNALIELLAVTLWGNLDYLIIDTPPGIGDAMLDLIRLVPRIEFFIITTPSQLAFETVKKQIALLKEQKVPVIGVAENMKMTQAISVQEQTRALGINFLGEIPYDQNIEASIGSTRKLLETKLGKKVQQMAKTALKQ